MTILWIAPKDGGVKVPMPSPAYKGYTTKKEELVKAERNVGGIVSMAIQGAVYSAEAGELIKHHIAWKHTIDVKWVALTAQEKTTIMNATSGEWFIVDYLDMDTDTIETGLRMYRGTGQTVTGYGLFNASTNQFQYYDVAMTLIEK